MTTYLLLVTITSLLGMILYSYVSKKPKRVARVRKIIYGSLIIFLLPILINFFKTGNVLDSIGQWLSNDYLKFIPLLGGLERYLWDHLQVLMVRYGYILL